MAKQLKVERGTGSVHRVVATVEFVSKAEDKVAISDLVRHLKIPRSSAYGIMRKLMEAKWLERKEGGYIIGTRLANLRFSQEGGKGLVAVLEPIIIQLRDSLEETIQLCVLGDDDKVLVIAKADGCQPISVTSQIGVRIPVNWSAAGRLLASAMDDQELRANLPAMIIPSPTGKAPTDPVQILSEIRSARKQGYFSQINQSMSNAGALSAAVLGSSGKCVAAISVLAPEHRMRTRRDEFLKILLPAAGAAAKLLVE